MRVSIVTVCLNAGSELAYTLESVLQQTHADRQIVLVDGGSWDTVSLQWLDAYKDRVDVFAQIDDAGIFSAMRQSLAFCDGRFVIFLNAGDRLYSSKTLSRIAENVDDASQVVYGDHLYCSAGKELLHRSSDYGLLMDRLREGSYSLSDHSRIPCHQATLTDLQLLRTLSYAQDYHICADHEFMLRAYAGGASFQYINDIFCLYSGGGISATQTSRLCLELSSAYGRYSEYPRMIDRLFGVDNWENCSGNALTGFDVAGLHLVGGLDPAQGMGSTISCPGANGVLFRSPAEDHATAMVFAGYNAVPDQFVTLEDDGPLARAELPVGSFALRVPFDRDLPPASIVTMNVAVAMPPSADEPRTVSFGMASFRFETAKSRGPKLLPGTRLPVSLGQAAQIQPLLLLGWSQLEESLIWSLGRQAALYIPLDARATQIRLLVSSNPFIPEGEQIVTATCDALPMNVLVQGRSLSLSMALPPGDGGSPRLISINLSKSSGQGQERRDLGVALHAIEVD